PIAIPAIYCGPIDRRAQATFYSARRTATPNHAEVSPPHRRGFGRWPARRQPDPSGRELEGRHHSLFLLWRPDPSRRRPPATTGKGPGLAGHRGRAAPVRRRRPGPLQPEVQGRGHTAPPQAVGAGPALPRPCERADALVPGRVHSTLLAQRLVSARL